MMKIKIFFVLGALALSSPLLAQSNPDPVVIDIIPNTQNPTETPAFFISRHAISPEQYCAFLNAVDTQEGRLYHHEWGTPTAADHVKNYDLATIDQSFDWNTHLYKYSLANQETNIVTATGVSTNTNTPGLLVPTVTLVPKRNIMRGIPMGDIARFCNWLDLGQPNTFPFDQSLLETGSYTFFEHRERKPTDSLLTIASIYQKGSLDNTLLAKYYMSVTRTPEATWRLPTRNELSAIFANEIILDYAVDHTTDPPKPLFYWTEDSYLMDRPPSTWDPYHVGFPYNSFGYYCVKNGGTAATRIESNHNYQNAFVPNTLAIIVFSANTIPTSGFRLIRFMDEKTSPPEPTASTSTSN